MKTLSIWLSYDLGIPGDYDGLYTWLDLHEAKVCGRSLAFLTYTYRDDLKRELAEELKAALDVTKKACVYLIYSDPTDGKQRGAFIIGRRGATPWHGYAELAVTEDV